MILLLQNRKRLEGTISRCLPALPLVHKIVLNPQPLQILLIGLFNKAQESVERLQSSEDLSFIQTCSHSFGRWKKFFTTAFLFWSLEGGRCEPHKVSVNSGRRIDKFRVAVT